VLKYKYAFQIKKNTQAILPKSTRRCHGLKLQKNAERSLKKEINLLCRLSQFSAHFPFPVSLFYAMIYRSVLVRRSRRHKQKAASLVAMHSTLRPGTVFDLQPDNGDELAMTSLKVRSDVEAARKTSSTPGTANNAACLADEVQNIGEVPKIDEVQNMEEVQKVEKVQNVEQVPNIRGGTEDRRGTEH